MRNPLAHPAEPTPRGSGRRDTDAPGKAITFTLMGGVVLTLNDALVKTLSTEFPPGQVMALRGLFIYIPILFLAFRAGGLHRLFEIKSWKGQALRGVCVVGSSFAFITALSLMPLADAIAIAFAGPLFITVLAPIILGEHVGWRRWLAVLIGFGGVLMIVQPGTTAFQWVAVFPMLAALLGGLRDIITRKMAPTEGAVAVLFVTTSTVVGVGFLSFFFSDWQPVGLRHAGYFVMSGLLIGVAHYLLIEAFRLGEAAMVAPFKYGNLIWATIFGYFLFGDLPGVWTLVGAGVLVVSGIYILRRESKLHPPEDLSKPD